MSMSVVGKNYGILNFLLLFLVVSSYFPVPVVGFSRIRILASSWLTSISSSSSLAMPVLILAWNEEPFQLLLTRWRAKKC